MLLKKLAIVFILSILLQKSFAQITDTLRYFLDNEERPVNKISAVYRLIVYKAKLTDTLYQRILYSASRNNIICIGTCKDAQGEVKQGVYIYYYNEGNKMLSTNFINNKEDGNLDKWYPDGKIEKKYHLAFGKMTGSNMSWYKNGNIEDSFALDNTGAGKGIGFYEDGKIRYKGDFIASVKSGLWEYYYPSPNNNKSMEIIFASNVLQTSKCYTLEGIIKDYDCVYQKEAAFIGGSEAWRNYLVKKMPRRSLRKKMKGEYLYKVVISFMITKDGKVSDIKTEKPDIAELDKLAESIIAESPAWEPAIEYNQPVNAYRRQPITFTAE